MSLRLFLRGALEGGEHLRAVLYLAPEHRLSSKHLGGVSENNSIANTHLGDSSFEGAFGERFGLRCVSFW